MEMEASSRGGDGLQRRGIGSDGVIDYPCAVLKRSAKDASCDISVWKQATQKEQRFFLIPFKMVVTGFQGHVYLLQHFGLLKRVGTLKL
uniref:Uncharacterized protein n=1 Tax=Oryza nivara TaxID=4536 RepID=A0A0E0IZ04_ORYNI